MPFNFWWRPNNTPVSRRGGRINIGLDLGGDVDPNDRSLSFQLRILSWPAQGYIYLCEVEGGQAGRGARESSQGRIIAAFHGNYHRDRGHGRGVDRGRGGRDPDRSRVDARFAREYAARISQHRADADAVLWRACLAQTHHPSRRPPWRGTVFLSGFGIA